MLKNLKRRWLDWYYRRAYDWMSKHWADSSVTVTDYVYPIEMKGDLLGRPLYLSVELTLEDWIFFKEDTLNTTRSMLIYRYTLNYITPAFESKNKVLTLYGERYEDLPNLLMRWLPMNTVMYNRPQLKSKKPLNCN